jgi:hypothetical protein
MPQASRSIQEFFLDSVESWRRIERSGSGPKPFHFRQSQADELGSAF